MRENRRRAAGALGVPGTALAGLTQVHGIDVAVLDDALAAGHERPMADAMVTRRPGLALGIVTADCAPVLFADAEAGVVGAAHAGWRGAVAGVIEATIAAMDRPRRPARAHRRRGRPVHRPAILRGRGRPARRGAGARRRRRALLRPGARARIAGSSTSPAIARRGCVAAGVAAEVTPHDTLALEDAFFSHRRRTLAGGGPIGHQLSAIAIGG